VINVAAENPYFSNAFFVRPGTNAPIARDPAGLKTGGFGIKRATGFANAFAFGGAFAFGSAFAFGCACVADAAFKSRAAFTRAAFRGLSGFPLTFFSKAVIWRMRRVGASSSSAYNCVIDSP
jgi:hypothetical protein